jgi:hypothetical protein
MIWNSILFICGHLRHLRLIPLRSHLPSPRLLRSLHSDAIGFVRGKPLARSIAVFRNSTRPNWYWLRSGKPIQERSRLLSRPIPPIMPLGSSENRGRHDCNHASSAPPGPRPFSWDGASIPMVMTVRFVIRLSASFEEGEIGFVRGNGASGLAQVVDRYELSKSSTRKDSNFIIGGRRECVPEIRPATSAGFSPQRRKVDRLMAERCGACGAAVA